MYDNYVATLSRQNIPHTHTHMTHWRRTTQGAFGRGLGEHAKGSRKIIQQLFGIKLIAFVANNHITGFWFRCFRSIEQRRCWELSRPFPLPPTTNVINCGRATSCHCRWWIPSPPFPPKWQKLDGLIPSHRLQHAIDLGSWRNPRPLGTCRRLIRWD